MEKGLIEISRYFGENREAVLYRKMTEERKHGLQVYQIHLYEGDKLLQPLIEVANTEDGAGDIAEDFVTYKNEEEA